MAVGNVRTGCHLRAVTDGSQIVHMSNFISPTVGYSYFGYIMVWCPSSPLLEHNIAYIDAETVFTFFLNTDHDIVIML